MPDRPPLSHRHVVVPVWGIYLVSIVLGLVAVGLLTYAVSDRVAQDATDAATAITFKQSVAGCDRNQVPRGYLTLRSLEVPSETAKLAEDYFRIVDCRATFAPDNAGSTVFLSAPLEECFLDLLQKQAFGKNAENVTTDPLRLHTDFNCT